LQYFTDGEFEKASVLFEKLYREKGSNDYYFDKYLSCLIELEEYQRAEKEIEEMLKKKPRNVKLYVTYGSIYERQYMEDKAAEKYREAIARLPKKRYDIINLANAFRGLMKYDLAIETYEKGAKLLKDDRVFSYNLGDLYRQKGETKKMINAYLNSIDASPGRIGSIKIVFQRYLPKEDFEELETQLYDRIQEEPEATYFIELLAWVYIQNKDYENAFRQLKSLDKRLGENGNRIFNLANIAARAKDYDAAIAAYDYIVNEKGITSTYYIDSKRESLNNKRDKLLADVNYSNEDLLFLEKEYEQFLDEFGRNRLTASIIKELADLEAFYLHDIDKAIAILKEMINYQGVNVNIQAEAKLNLGDFYVMKGDVWEATLLYSQVDKAFKDDAIGHEARFRNARLSYFNADFQWAQAQFDVLKASTSKLIANDALDLSVFIMDNMGLDTSAAALALYAQAELLIFQNQTGAAVRKLEELKTKFPEHSLQDDILYAEYKIAYKNRDYQAAADYLRTIIEKHPEEIRADNALYQLAVMEETIFDNPDKAKELFEKLFVDYSDSMFAIEARKEFRRLRGDEIGEEN